MPSKLSNNIPPTDCKNLSGLFLCFLRIKFYANGPSRVSLRLGHTRVLTCHWHVIHCARAASLRLSLQGEIKLPYEGQPFGGVFFIGRLTLQGRMREGQIHI